MSFLMRAAAGLGSGVQYSDITVVTSGSALASNNKAYGTTLAQDDVVVMVMGRSGNRSWSYPAGFSALQENDVLANTNYQVWVFYKVMGSTPDTQIASFGTADDYGYTYYVLRGVQTNDPFYRSGVAAGGDPPVVDVFAKCLVIAAAVASEGAGTSYTAAPSGYSNFQVIDASGNQDTYVGSAIKTITAGVTENPGTFTLSGSSTSYAGLTLAIRPYSSSYTPPTKPSVVAYEQNGSAGSGTVVVNKPTGTTDGDLLVAFAYTTNNGTGSVTPPGGWATRLDAQGDSSNFYIATKTAASEGSSYSFTVSAESLVIVVAFRNATFDTVGTVFAPTSTALDATSIDVAENALLCFFGADDQTTTINATKPFDMTQLYNGFPSGGTTSALVAYMSHPGGATGNKCADISSSTAKDGAVLFSVKNS